MFARVGTLLVLLLAVLSLAAAELRMVYHLHRHGARGPIFKDTDISGWNQMEQVTSVGMRQLYLQGAEYRQRYKDFLPSEYDASAILFRSTYFNRTISSGISFIHGLFPPGMGPDIPDGLQDSAVPPVNYKFDFDKLNLGKAAMPNKLLPIPIHINSNDTDYIARSFDICDIVLQYKKDALNSDQYKKIDETFKGIYADVAKAVNLPVEKVDLVTAFHVMDNLLADYYDSRTPLIDYSTPLWRSLYALYNVSVIYFKYATKDQVNFYTTRLYQDIQKLFDGVVKDPKADLKWSTYAVHDSTINMVLYQLGITSWECILKKYQDGNFDFDPKCPYPCQIASSVMLELHKDGDKHFVRFFFEDKQYPLGGEMDLEYSKFIDLLKPGIASDFDEKCGVSAYKKVRRGEIPIWKVFVLALLTFATISLSTLVVVGIMKLRNIRSEGYSRF
eukprot:TRINITY_DN6225_c0_g1_i1.p1 TRINITY_DN6225_c0_g1~~TRINITY_DN6225_c0_g1_i1.p1  ORF type:complete len:446 (-),score=88.19 TRINITY_DN6225_c0_g1_i1:1060-2397(-)